MTNRSNNKTDEVAANKAAPAKEDALTIKDNLAPQRDTRSGDNKGDKGKNMSKKNTKKNNVVAMDEGPSLLDQQLLAAKDFDMGGIALDRKTI